MFDTSGIYLIAKIKIPTKINKTATTKRISKRDKPLRISKYF